MFGPIKEKGSSPPDGTEDSTGAVGVGGGTLVDKANHGFEVVGPSTSGATVDSHEARKTCPTPPQKPQTCNRNPNALGTQAAPGLVSKPVTMEGIPQ